jgi:Uma2 family endonuclease
MADISMALPSTLPTFSHDEYLAFERDSDRKHEYLDGLIYAMAGSSPEHSTISVNIAEIVTRQLRGTPCRPFSSDMRVRCIPLAPQAKGRQGLFAYPDFIVVCGDPAYHDEHHDVLVNPVLIVEVLSPSTEAYDRDEKVRRYRELASFTDYLLVSQDRYCVEHHSKAGDGSWTTTRETDLSKTVPVESIGCTIPLREVYEWVELSSGSDASTRSS